MRNKLYLECTSGISGDMTVAALLDLGADQKKLVRTLKSLPVKGFDIKISRVMKSGIDACDFDVLLDHENHDHDMKYLYGHDGDSHSQDHEEHHYQHSHEAHEHPHSHEHHVQETHGNSHTYTETMHSHHGHHHHEHRGLNEIMEIIEHADMTDRANPMEKEFLRFLPRQKQKPIMYRWIRSISMKWVQWIPLWIFFLLQSVWMIWMWRK